MAARRRRVDGTGREEGDGAHAVPVQLRRMCVWRDGERWAASLQTLEGLHQHGEAAGALGPP
eukprot:14074312-Heterocapsa_arctica.AAC.1